MTAPSLLEEAVFVLHGRVCRCPGHCPGWQWIETQMRATINRVTGSEFALDVYRANKITAGTITADRICIKKRGG